MPIDHLRVRIESKAIEGDVAIYELRGREAISSLFEFEISVACDYSAIAVDDAVGSVAAIIFEQCGDNNGEPDDAYVEVRRISGLIAECRDLRLGDSGGYWLKIVPLMWLSTLVETLDVFQDLSIPQIIKKKLEMVNLADGTDFEMRLADDYPERDFVVQYKETDRNFIQRLSEHWGVAYYFIERDGNNVAVFCDKNEYFQAISGDPNVAYVEHNDARGVRRIESRTRMVPKVYVQRDYNYRQPSMDLTGIAQGGWGSGGIVEYGGHFKTSEEAGRFALIRCEERQMDRLVYNGESDSVRFAAGHRVTVTDPQRGDIDLLLTEVTHYLKQVAHFGGEVVPYSCTFEAIPADVTYRPPRRTHKPRVQGVLTGIIESASGSEYADIDEDGRYRVRFLFDTSDADEAKASRPCRMMQPHAGAGYGMHFPLRGDIEVLIAFVDGDPDRPIIAGTVPNPQTASPVTAANKERNIIRTGGGNEINIDDTEGSARIKMTVPHKNTIFQLGAPNAAEAGAILETTGASTTLATAGTNVISSFQLNIEAFQAFRASGDVVSVASKPGTHWLVLGLGFVETLIGTTQAIVGFVQAGMDLHAKAQMQKAVAAQDDATAKQAECATCRTELAALEATLPSGTHTTGITAARTAYDTSTVGRDRIYIEQLKKRRIYDIYAEKTVGEWTHQNEAAETVLAEQHKVAYDKSVQATADAASAATFPALDEVGNPILDSNGAPTTLPGVDATKTALTTAVDDAIADPNISAADKALFEAYKAKFDGCTALCSAGVDTARASAEQAMQDYRDTRQNQSEHIANCYRAQQVLGTARAVRPLISAITAVYTLLQKSSHMVQLNSRYLSAQIAQTQSGRLPPTYYPPLTIAKSPMHVVGAKNSLELHGIEDATLWSENVLIFGQGTTTSLADTPNVPNMAAGRVTINACKETWLGSMADVVVSGGDKVTVNSPDIAMEASDGMATGKFELKSKQNQKFEAELGDISVRADGAGKKVLVTAGATLINRIANNSASIVMGANGGGFCTTKTGSWSQKLTNTGGVKLGKAGTAELVMKPAETTLQHGNAKIKLAAAGAVTSASKWTIKTSAAIALNAGGNVTAKGRKILLG